jgi:hypothetical protein
MQLIHTEAELEERLSRPTEQDFNAMSALDGDLIILGAGGKMGPSLAKLARRAADSKPNRDRKGVGAPAIFYSRGSVTSRYSSRKRVVSSRKTSRRS